ncbi:hypothetical protein LOAG_02116 [Loa loa]|uniref:Uncharacterized protein n=1 Tax=Loa loa TaxID=7209 RepID=A0A1S0U7A4_LOALO|nr:hypothetical protein LOAG_02116 [Loa loa]EFO26366.1 hypothetical protein LOAG_02116 [Loa loa]
MQEILCRTIRSKARIELISNEIESKLVSKIKNPCFALYDESIEVPNCNADNIIKEELLILRGWKQRQKVSTL